jgi:uncharacterized membrane protein YgcG
MYIIALAVILIPDTRELLIKMYAEKVFFFVGWKVAPCFQEGMSFKILA